MILKEQITDLLEKKFAGTDYFLVEVKESPAKVAVFIDHSEAVKLADCVDLTRYLQNELGEVLDSRELEVSSPGMEEPLKVFRQYQKRMGQEVAVLLKNGVRKNGVLKGASLNEGSLTLLEMTSPDPLVIPMDQIKETKVVFSFNNKFTVH